MQSVLAYHCECLWIVSLCMGTCGRRLLCAFSSNGLFFFRRNRRMSRIVLPASATSELSAKCSTLSDRFLCRHCKSSVVKLDWNGNAIVASISTTPLRQWRSSRLRCRRKSIQKLNRVQGTRLVYKLMILLSSFCHSGVKLSNKLFIVQCTCRDKNEGCWYPSS